MNKAIFFVIACIFPGLFLPGCKKKAALDKPVLVIGMELAYPPFEMTDPAGKPTGVSVDMAYALGEALGREVRIQNIPFTGLITSLKTGKIDLIISSMTANDERRQSIDFSDPYLRTGLCLLVGKNTGIESVADADRPNRTLVVNQGTTGHVYAEQHLKQAKLRVLDKEQSCVLEVVQGRADAFIYDQMSIYKNWTRNPETTEPLLRPFQEETWAIGIRKGNEILREEVNHFLAEYKKQGGFEQLGERYLSEQKKAFAKMGIPFVF